jgi:hypothetical protein
MNDELRLDSEELDAIDSFHETKYFTTSLEDQMSLSSLGYKQACILNIVQKECFLFYTPDLVSPK